MNLTLEPIKLYIHPDNGPITSMDLNMLDVELSIIQPDTNSNRDNARVSAIIALIKQNFPDVQPEACRQQLRLLISRLVHVSIYDGIVLHLPGSIDGPPPPQGYTQADIDNLEAEITNLTSKLESERQDHTQQLNTAKASIEALRTENDGLRSAGRAWQAEKRNLNGELTKTEDEKYAVEKKLGECDKQKTELDEKIAGMQETIEKERRERPVIVNLQRDITTLRNELKDAKEVEKQLSAAHSKLEQENRELREKLRRCMEDVPSTPPTQSDGAKGPWLD
jgi:hypothetical protein